MGAHPRKSRWTIALSVLTLGAVWGAWQCAGENDPEVMPSGQVDFTDVTAETGLGGFRHVTGAVGDMWMPETMGGGGGFIDYDGDGWLDIVLVRGSAWSEPAKGASVLALYRNVDGRSFLERTSEAGLDGIASYAFGVTVADYDNDGDDDFYVTALRRNLLFRNEGGTFVEVGSQAGVAGPPEWSTAAVFFDADLDGRLDLFVGNYIEWSPETDIPCSLAGGVRSYCTPDAYNGLPPRFYRNNGDGTFSERTSEAGFGADSPGKTLAAALFDHNTDGRPDLVVANDTERDLLYENRGIGTFEEIGVVAGIAFDRNGRARAGMGIDTAVIDSSGHPTIFVGNFAREMVGAYQVAGRKQYADRALALGIGQASTHLLTFGLFTFDADLDGEMDLFTANGHINPDVDLVDGAVAYRQPARLYRNRGNGTFEACEGGIWNLAMVARGAAYADYDRDGDLDVLLVENGGPAHLWRNEVRSRAETAGLRNGFLRVRLEGRRSNRNGIGARVEARVGRKRMARFVKTGSSYLSASESVVTFGLGQAVRIDSLTVFWPGGHVDSHVDVAGNQEIKLVEGSGWDVQWGEVES